MENLPIIFMLSILVIIHLMFAYAGDNNVLRSSMHGLQSWRFKFGFEKTGISCKCLSTEPVVS